MLLLLFCCFGLSGLCLLLLDLGQENHWLLKVHPLRVLEHLPKVEIALKGAQGLDPQKLHIKAQRKEKKAQGKQVKHNLTLSKFNEMKPE